MQSRYAFFGTQNLPQLDFSQNYETLLIPHSLSKFVYRKGIPYIRLSQQKINNDIYSHDFTHILQETKIIKTYILDTNLAVIYEGNYRDFEQELQNKEKQQQKASEIVPKNRPQYIQQDRKQSGLCLAPIQYRVYQKLINDFIIGRYKFVRNFQSHKICSDSISKQHCSISHFRSNNEQVNEYLKVIKKAIFSRTPIFSNWKKVPIEIWEQVFQFLRPKERYSLLDLGSRNGTWVCEIGTQSIRVQEAVDYQFENQSYSIHVSKLFTSHNSEQQSILQHNKKAHKILQQYKKQINWNYYERANKIIIAQDIQNLYTKSDQKIQIIIFKLKYRDYYQYYLLAVNQTLNKKYTIGCKYDIDINPEEYDAPSLHGRIYVEAGKWVIETYEVKRNGEFRKIWVRNPKMHKYVLATQKQYKIRLGVSCHLSLDFINF